MRSAAARVLAALYMCSAISIAGALAPASAQTAPTALEVIVTVQADGSADADWLAVLRRRLDDARYALFAPVRKPLSAEEQAWADLIRSRRGAWQQEVAALAAPFAPSLPPPSARILLGNRGGEDAMSHDARTMAFDLAALHANYGDADSEENRGRIDRFFRHEFTHLLQRAWFTTHPAAMPTALDRALVEMWTEGQGNYHSLSGRWLPVDGQRSEATANALAQLEPRLLARLAALACASPSEATKLSADLSNGRFDQKWGALPVALWLMEAQRLDDDALRDFIRAEPPGVWSFLERHLSPPLQPVLAEVRANAGRCARTAASD